MRPQAAFVHALVRRRSDSAIAKARLFGECPRRFRTPRPSGPMTGMTRRLAAAPKDRVQWPPPVRPLARALGALALAAFLAAPIAAVCARRRCRTPIRWWPAPTASISARATLRSPRRRSAATCRKWRPDQKRDYLITYLADVIVLAPGRRAAEDRRPSRRQAPHRVRAQQGADGDDAAGRRPGRRDRRRRCTRSMTKPSSRCRARRRCTRATSWLRPKTRPRRSKPS